MFWGLSWFGGIDLMWRSRLLVIGLGKISESLFVRGVLSLWLLLGFL